MEQDTWTVLDAYFRDNDNFLTKHQLDSYNDLIISKIPNTIKSLNPFIMIKNDEQQRPRHEVKVFIGGEDGQSIYFVQPTQNNKPLLPNYARLHNITYKADILVDVVIHYITYDPTRSAEPVIHIETLSKIKLGSIPVMLKSCVCYLEGQSKPTLREYGECPYDQGGYMIVDGKEKVIVAQERIVTNRLFINNSKNPDYSHQGLLRCTIEEAAVFPKTINLAVYKKTSRKNCIVFSLPSINHEICLFTLFRALGVESDMDILKHIVGDIDDPDNKHLLDFLYPSMRDGAFLYSQKQVLEYLSGYVKYQGNIVYVQHVLMNDLFPAMNGDTFYQKPLYLGNITRHIVQVCLGIEKESDRDSYGYKRVDVSGFLMANLFRDFYNAFRVSCRSAIDRQYNFGAAKTDETAFYNLINGFNKWQIFDPNIIENGIVRSLKASWGVDKDPSKQGAVQDLNRISFIGYASHVRRVNTPIDRSIKMVAPHRLHATQWGSMCPCETPDGASIGLLKNFAMLCHVTFDCKSSSIEDCLKDLQVKPLSQISLDDLKIKHAQCKVIINGNWFGTTTTPTKLVEQLRVLRRNALINVMTSIVWNIKESEIYINTEAGRCCRPLYVLDKSNKLRITLQDIEDLKKNKRKWQDLLSGKTRKTFSVTDSTYYSPKDAILSFVNSTLSPSKKQTTIDDDAMWKLLQQNQSCIEFIDVEESENCLIAMTFESLKDSSKKFTHVEIHPSTIFAVLTANIPFANHNQAPRNYFSGAQGKQAIGVYSTAFNRRMDTAGLVLYYPQRRVVNTRYMHYIGNNDMPSGENTIVAIMTYTGFNQEDSVIINKSAIDKGLFNLTYYKTIINSEKSDKNGSQRIIFSNPSTEQEKGTTVQNYGKRFADYSKLDENGFPLVNAKIEPGDVFLGKCLVKKEAAVKSGADEESHDIFLTGKTIDTWTDKSPIADKTLMGTIDKVYVFDDSRGQRTCKIKMRKVRTPVLGDKTGSNHAQKGVVGMIIPHESMPYTKDGIVPDIIINPHAIPTRMTIGHLLECVFAKVGCLDGEFLDATPFCHQDIDAVYDKLQSHGYEKHANEIMYNGINGEQIHTDIFIGPTYYIRMKHMVADKINYRSNEGGYVSLTRQPVKSRAKGGGLRIGEMETNTLLSHGMSAFLRESLMDRADMYQTYLEHDTGNIAISNDKDNYAKTQDGISRVQIPYSAKTLCQELESMAIHPRLLTELDEFYQDEPVEVEWEDDVTMQVFDQDEEDTHEDFE